VLPLRRYPRCGQLCDLLYDAVLWSTLAFFVLGTIVFGGLFLTVLGLFVGLAAALVVAVLCGNLFAWALTRRTGTAGQPVASTEEGSIG